ncbi:hypothetical protein CPB85DRAFT_1433210 [Mucidula mucida]|nr:hypothetical protein CPB85DRAFT_1433210 [Mucidula mucida]
MNALGISLAGGVLATTYIFKPVQWIRVHGFWSSLYWTIRSWLWNYPVTQDYGVWKTGDPNDLEVFESDRRRLLRMWRFLRPFFPSCGYHLYVPKDSADIYSYLVPITPMSSGMHSFPFAPCLYKTDSEAEFPFYVTTFASILAPLAHQLSLHLFGQHGTELGETLWAVSGSKPTKELQALRLLQSDALRDDPRNHTIPVLDFIEFNNQVFATRATRADFVTVGELVRYGQAFLEATAFIHEHNIAHGDIDFQNMVMDVMVSEPKAPFGAVFAGVRGPERKYAFIDFETATLPAPSDSSSPDAEHCVQRCSPAADFACASKRDVDDLASALEIHLRCIEDVMPDLGTLLDSMQNPDDPHQLTAAAALSRYEELCSSLNTDDMQREVKAIWWTREHIRYRVSPPVYISDA